VATVTIEREAPIPADAEFKLRAEVQGGSPSAHQWKRNGTDIAGATSEEYKATATDDTAGTYTVDVTVGGQKITADAVEVKVTTAAEEPPEFHRIFATGTAVIIAVGAAVVLLNAGRTSWDIKKSDLAGAQGDRMLAAALGLPLTLVGGALLALGAWMAVVEWRGRFKPKPADGPVGKLTAAIPIDIPKTIEAVGKLRGAAILLVVGALLMLGGAWIANGAAEPEPAGGTTPPAAPSPSPSPTPTPTPPTSPTPTVG
jgi:hypothetical protein